MSDGMVLRGGIEIGTILGTSDPLLAEVAAQAFDVLWLDLEHSPLTVADMPALVLAGQAAGARVYVRLPRWDSDRVAALLDLRIDGVVAPKIASAREAAAFLGTLRHPPDGSRGFAPRRANGYGRGAVAEVAGVVQIETREALARVDEICAVPGLEAVVVGTADLAVELGLPLGSSAEPLAEAITLVGAAARAAGVGFGVATGGVAGELAWIVAQVDLLLYASDVRLYEAALRAAADALRVVGAQHT